MGGQIALASQKLCFLFLWGSYKRGTSVEVFPPICRVSVVVTRLLSSINAIPLCPDVFFLFEDPPFR